MGKLTHRDRIWFSQISILQWKETIGDTQIYVTLILYIWFVVRNALTHLWRLRRPVSCRQKAWQAGGTGVSVPGWAQKPGPALCPCHYCPPHMFRSVEVRKLKQFSRSGVCLVTGPLTPSSHWEVQVPWQHGGPWLSIQSLLRSSSSLRAVAQKSSYSQRTQAFALTSQGSELPFTCRGCRRLPAALPSARVASSTINLLDWTAQGRSSSHSTLDQPVFCHV